MTARGTQDEALPRAVDPRPQAATATARAATAPATTQHHGTQEAPRPALDQGRGHSVPARAQVNGRPNSAAPAPTNGHDRVNGQDRANGCTAPQLRRFIKSRPYVPMHELRRRFAIDGGDDDVTQVFIERGQVYVGLPSREGGLLGELLRGGEIGYELSLDPRTPVVVGVYPMRPIPRS